MTMLLGSLSLYLLLALIADNVMCEKYAVLSKVFLSTLPIKPYPF
ncbi:MAG: hypothetical protein ACJAWS_003119 [Oleiphilaceae bacterium]|jgi:hypothetical protein